MVAAGATAYALVDSAVLPGKGALDNALGRCDPPPPPPAPRGTPQAPVLGTFRSARRRREVDFALLYPPGYRDGAHLPVCLSLHGYGANCRDAISTGGYPELIAGSPHPFVLAGVDGGGGYWHPHPTDDPLGMLVDDFLPYLAGRGLDTGRVAVCGWSMGGYGALVCGLAYPGRFRVIIATSPAVYHAVRTLRDRLPDPAVVQMPAGCHDGRLWSYVAPGQVRAIAAALGG